MMKLSIVIPALDQETPIGRAIQQFWTPVPSSPVEVIVADAGSMDGTLSVARLLADHVLEVDGSIEQWRSHARNAGAARASGDVVLFVDPEARIVTPLEQLLSHLQGLFGNGHPIACAVPRVEAIEGEAEIEPLTDEPAARTYRPGALAVRRSAFLECGGFDEGLSADEEPDLLTRIAKHGQVEALHEVEFAVMQPALPIEEAVA
jgi:glycosyltransferase involved in cell wall biosynthesis